MFGKIAHMMPGLGNVMNSVDSANQAQEFLGLANNILLGEGFKHFTELSAAGVKLTPISNVELELIMASSGYLMSVAQKKDGKIVGFNVSDKIVKEELAKIANGQQKIVNETTAMMKLGGDGYAELYQMYNQPR